MTGDRVWIEILMYRHHVMLRDSEALRARIYTGTIEPRIAGEEATNIATQGRWLDRQLEAIEQHNLGRFISVLEQSMRRG